MRFLRKIENFFITLFFLSGVAISLYAVYMRYVVGASQSWATEIYTTLLVWAIFIGFSTALRDDRHVAIDLLYDRVSPKMKKIFDLIVVIVGIAFSIFFIITGADMTLTTFQQGIRTIDVGMPLWIYYLIMPIAGLLLLIRFIEKGILIFKKPTTFQKEDQQEWQL